MSAISAGDSPPVLVAAMDDGVVLVVGIGGWAAVDILGSHGGRGGRRRRVKEGRNGGR